VRHRESGSFLYATIYTVDTDPDNTVHNEQAYVSGNASNGTVKTIDDVVTPNFRKRMEAGEVIINPCKIVTDTRSSSGGTITFVHPGWGKVDIRGPLAAFYASDFADDERSQPIWALDEDALGQQALVRAFASMNSGDVLSSVSFAEAGKTINMLRKPMSGSLKLLDKCIGRKLSLIKRGATVVQAATDAWLEYRFGWRPLLQDIEGLAKASVAQYPGEFLQVAKGTAKREAKASFQRTGMMSPRLGTGLANFSAKRKISATAKCYFNISGLSRAEYQARAFGLGLDTVPSHIWEVVPFSFVVDRFVDVGSWLRAITPSPGVVLRGSVLSVREDFELVVDRAGINALIHSTEAGDREYTELSDDVYVENRRALNRYANPSLPSTPPVNKTALTFSQNADHVALMVQQLTGGFAKFRI
jgi:hypothetical protein